MLEDPLPANLPKVDILGRPAQVLVKTGETSRRRTTLPDTRDLDDAKQGTPRPARFVLQLSESESPLKQRFLTQLANAFSLSRAGMHKKEPEIARPPRSDLVALDASEQEAGPRLPHRKCFELHEHRVARGHGRSPSLSSVT
jgi:hypothetical protein